MSKTISGSKLAVRSKKLFSKVESIARTTRLIVRNSAKFTADGFVIALIQAVTSGKGSFNQLAMALALNGTKPLSRQALWKRVDCNAVSFMMEVTRSAVENRWSKEVLIASKIFNRVILEDSSQVKLPKENNEDFPAHGNGKGETAGCKFDLAFDLLTGEPLLQSLRLATDQDKELGKDLVDLVQSNDLVLRDMGYFSVKEFMRIDNLHACWLSRMPINVQAWDLEGRKLEDVLRAAKGNRLDLQMEITEERYGARLIAVRATAEVAGQRRRERMEQARSKGKQATKDTLTRCDWHIIVTNVVADRMSADDLFKLYAVRWNIEIAFRAWKQSGHLVEALGRHSNLFHLQVLMLAGILQLILIMKITRLMQGSCRKEDFSIEKVADSLAVFLLRITSLSELDDYNPDQRHIKMDRRKRKSLRNIGISTLS
jgi:IS4 transposase